MAGWKAYDRSLDSPLKTLFLVFILWKLLLLLIAVLSPGPGYDTSTVILLRSSLTSSEHGVSTAESLIARLTIKLLRWDAIYFAKIAERGYLHEQEWAFGWGFTRLVSFIAQSKLAHTTLSGAPLIVTIWAGVTIAHVSHLLSVFVLHHLISCILPEPSRKRTAFLTATLHILSPASLFLSAPYGESLFSLLNFLGMLFYVKSVRSHPRTPSTTKDLYRVCGGILFGLATTVRSNGLLSGTIFAYDLIVLLTRPPRWAALRNLVVTTVAGIAVAAGFIVPQWIAWETYCVQPNTVASQRPWCSYWPPSIYAWVQDEYWDLGFLRYWTPSNAPLFLLAAPMLYVLISTALAAPSFVTSPPAADYRDFQPLEGQQIGALQNSTSRETAATNTFARHCLRRLAVPQLVLAVLAFTNFHVQIVNRIASGYPVWYLGIAVMLDDAQSSYQSGRLKGMSRKAEWTVRAMIMYAIIQGGLFASFLPPA
ncbi:GPI mannosyltransferase 2 [Cryomyces antarcticus]